MSRAANAGVSSMPGCPSSGTPHHTHAGRGCCWHQSLCRPCHWPEESWWETQSPLGLHVASLKSQEFNSENECPPTPLVKSSWSSRQWRAGGGIGQKTTGQSHKAGPSSLSVALTLPNLSRNSQGLRLDSDHAHESASRSLKGSKNPRYYF